MGKNFKLIIVIFAVLILSGCSMFNDGGQSVDSRTGNNIYVLSHKLAFYEVGVYQKANALKIVLPNKIMYKKGSSNFTAEAYEVMTLLSYLVSYYRESTVAVTGYVSERDEVSAALAMERARKIMDGLWRTKISPNFVYASGKNLDNIGDQFSVADCTLIEIKY